MRMRSRKLIGTVVLLLFLAAYAVMVVSIGAGRIVDASPLARLAFFIVAGLAWVLPAGVLIRWMQRPDAPGALKRP
ncbi:MAG: DUF2842 domain-containing protein [Methyloceanibacter sp.]|jgi:uncharacterized membrane protein